MGDPKNPNSLSFSLPPGCRFFPSDEQLLCFYLTPKNAGDRHFGFDVLKEIDLYDFDPFDLPDTACFRFGRGGRKRHWYCYVARVLKEGRRRRAGGGFWKISGRVRDVLGGGAGKVVVGTRRRFVFYLGDSPKTAVRTDWVMDEYAVIDHHMASFVVCRVFVKSHQNNTSDRTFSSCAEESVATMRHISVQHNGTIGSVTDDANVLNNRSPDPKMDVLRFPMRLVSELETSGPVGAQQMRSCGPSDGRNMIAGSLTAQELVAILEDDFLELDDLLYPLPDELVANPEEDFLELDDLVSPLPGQG